jgi:hypothetical protein
VLGGVAEVHPEPVGLLPFITGSDLEWLSGLNFDLYSSCTLINLLM